MHYKGSVCTASYIAVASTLVAADVLVHICLRILLKPCIPCSPCSRLLPLLTFCAPPPPAPGSCPPPCFLQELLDMERENEELRAELARVDVRGIKETTASLHAQLREARAAEEELRGVEAVVARLPQLQAEAEALRPVAAQVDAMEEQLRGLRDLDSQRLALSRDIAALQPKVGRMER